MEIDIPNLNDLEFVERCGACGGRGRRTERQWVLVPGKKRKKLVESEVTCIYCDATGQTLTPVGTRLLEFLRAMGVRTIDEHETDMKRRITTRYGVGSVFDN